jgi:BirA family biotin operon repressor/biotin-[acetyl-CoA-carboxylase] ligase
MSALAVREALLETSNLPTDIKWPNDIIANEKKLCGILAETVDTSGGSAVVVGIGINLTQDSFPSELEDVATSVQAVSSKPPDLEVVLEKLVNALSRRYENLQEPNGTVDLLKEWCAQSSYCSGKRVRVTDALDSFIGTTRGLEEDGALKVETDNGQLKVIRAGDIASVRSWEGEQ